MVFMVEPRSIAAAVTRLPHSVDREPTLSTYCHDVARSGSWYHLYRFAKLLTCGKLLILRWEIRATIQMIQNRRRATHRRYTASPLSRSPECLMPISSQK